MSAETVHAFAPRPPSNHSELSRLLADRAQKANDPSKAPAVAQPSVVATSVPHFPSEAEARSTLARAIEVREAASIAVAKAETAVAQAQAISAEAQLAIDHSVSTEMRGADDLARRITEWAVRGGDRPELVPDAECLDARRDQDRARVHADAALQAVNALSANLAAMRQALAAAAAGVSAAARDVAAAMVEEIAKRGQEAEAVYRRAQQVCRAVYEVGNAGIPGGPRTLLARPATMKLGECGMLAPLPETHLSGRRQDHTQEWRALLLALEADPRAALTAVSDGPSATEADATAA